MNRLVGVAVVVALLAASARAQEASPAPSTQATPTQAEPTPQATPTPDQPPPTTNAVPPPLPPVPAETAPAPPLALPVLVEPRTFTWPFTLDLHVLVGAEPHDQGTPIAFGIGAEALWHGWVGPFLSLLASEGSPVQPPTMNGKQPPFLADRVSVPLGVALRPFGVLASEHDGWTWRLLAGVGVQLGVAIEYLRSSDDAATTAGLHLGISVDVPLYGGPLTGGVAIRLAGRMIATPAITLEANKSIQEPTVSGQLFAGICYVP